MKLISLFLALLPLSCGTNIPIEDGIPLVRPVGICAYWDAADSEVKLVYSVQNFETAFIGYDVFLKQSVPISDEETRTGDPLILTGTNVSLPHGPDEYDPSAEITKSFPEFPDRDPVSNVIAWRAFANYNDDTFNIRIVAVDRNGQRSLPSNQAQVTIGSADTCD